MDHFAGLDVSVKETSVCIVDETGKIVREMKLASEPDALVAVLKTPSYHFEERSRLPNLAALRAKPEVALVSRPTPPAFMFD